jgi:radical SAM enzyme (TIGR01210 family)
VNDGEILALRGPKATLDQDRAYASAWEQEPDAAGILVPTAVVFLTNRECPFRCVMCDLWVNTLDVTVRTGAIATQIRTALADLPAARQIKLYNAGSFFDPHAIPPEDDEDIAACVRGFDRVIVEAHPAFLRGAAGERCVRFRDLLMAGPQSHSLGEGGLQTRLEVAIGLETAHPATLARLNKRMTVETFRDAAGFLARHDIALRVFILLNPPFLRGDAAIEWACRSIDVAVECGATACSVILTRGGNGAMEALGRDVERPRLPALEAVVEYGLSLRGPRIFADLWDVARFFDCDCSPRRAERLMAMNRRQRVAERVMCGCRT